MQFVNYLFSFAGAGGNIIGGVAPGPLPIPVPAGVPLRIGPTGTTGT